MSAKVLVIGAGTMGFEMIKALVGAGYEVLVCDVDAARVVQAVAAGAKAVRTPREGAETADVSLLSLGTPEIVEVVVCGDDGILSGAEEGPSGPCPSPAPSRRNSSRSRTRHWC